MILTPRRKSPSDAAFLQGADPSSAPTSNNLEARVAVLERKIACMEEEQRPMTDAMKILEIKEVARRFARGDRSAMREYNMRQRRGR